jgi:hypothetical protein
MAARTRLLVCLVPAVLAGAACDVAISAGGIEGSFERTLTVSGPVELEVGSGSGDIVVHNGPAGAIHIKGRARASSSPWASFSGRSAAERIREIEQNPPIEQSGNQIRVGPRETNWNGWNGISISYEITVPATTRLAARSGSGDLEVADLAGPVEASTGSGDIRVGRITGSVKARTGSGEITLDGAAAVEASTGSGNVVAWAVRGDLEARSGSGDITIGQKGKGRIDVSTGSGDVELTGATGPVRVRASSGDILVEGTPVADWDVGASSGDVRLRLPGQSGFDLDLRSDSGHIETSMPITTTGTQGRRELRGQVRGGGPRVHVSTSSGAIVIQ